MRVRDLHGWIPQPGGATAPGETFPISAEQVFIERVVHVYGTYILFTCRFQDRSVFYTFPMLDEKEKMKIAEILHENIGKTLLSIGAIEIPED